MHGLVIAALFSTLIPTGPAPTAAKGDGTQRVASPNGRIEVVVSGGERLHYAVRWDGKPLLTDARLSIDVDHVRLGVAPRIVAVTRRTVDAKIEPPVRLKAASLPERYNELHLQCEGGYAVVFRAYDEGVAYRFEITRPAPAIKIYDEEATFGFAGNPEVVFPHEEDGFFSHNEPLYKRFPLASITPKMMATLPAVVATAAGPKVAIAESDVDGYPGLWLRGTGGPALAATFPPYPLEEKATRDRDIKVVRAADFIATTHGRRTLPWRVLGVAEKDRDLPANPLVYLLQRPSEIQDTSWIRPGKVAWDWWNDRNLIGVKFKPGINTETYEYYIDFASRSGIDYIILDEGWYETGNVLKVVPQIDLPRLLARAKAKNVGIILWVVWKTFADQLEPALAQFEKWGVKGVKVDFMQRDDQPVIDFYHRVSRELAKRHMMVDYHGGQRPALMTRTWPNIVSTEGVKGLEHDKWSNLSDPEHAVTLPFTRMFLGPMDYTPGAMLNATKAAFKIDFHRPMSQGTRCHQLAMYVVYESPLQMLADSPTNYEREPETVDFLRDVPTVWDETRVLDGKLGDYVVIARRKGNDWFVGAMSDWTARSVEIDLSFLAGAPGGGTQLGWNMVAFADGPEAATNGASYTRSSIPVTKGMPLRLGLAPGGGFAAHITPVWQNAKPTLPTAPKP